MFMIDISYQFTVTSVDMEELVSENIISTVSKQLTYRSR